jgi:hypothetical protein
MYKIGDDEDTYLQGSAFSSGYSFRFTGSHKDEAGDRVNWLNARIRGKSIIHVGCCDHLPIIEKKRTRGYWLHEHLVKNATHCVGVDTDAEGVRFLVEELQQENIYCADLLRDEIPQIDARSWDYLFLGEVLEHIDNPVAFLQQLREKYSGRIGELIVTVPNAFKYKNVRNALKGRERINSDHRYWFTPYTLAKVISCAGCRPREFTFVTSYPIEDRIPIGWFKRLFLNRYPAFRETLVMTATL